MKRCDHCGGRLGMVVRRKWRWRFCKLTCKTAFEHRHHEEARRRIREPLKLSGFLRSGTSLATEYAGIMSARLKFVLSALAVLGTASAALAMTQSSAHRHTIPAFRSQYQISVQGSDLAALDSDRNSHQSAVYFEPTRASFNAYTYCASAQLAAASSKRSLQAEFRFPAFSVTPNVSVQVISSISAVPMRVRAVRISEIRDPSGVRETRIIIEAEPIFDVPAGGFYFANLVVTGVPVSPPTVSKPTQLLP
jgi:hypothetical protein